MREYDAEGNLLVNIDALGRVTSYVYNGHELPVERRDALGETLHDEYDQTLRPSTFVNQNGKRYLLRVVSGESVACYADGATAIAPVADWALPHDRSEALAHVDAWRAHRANEDERRHQVARARVREAAASLAGGDQVLYYLCDHLGTPLELVDADGRVAWAARYRAWGGLLEEGGRGDAAAALPGAVCRCLNGAALQPLPLF